MKSIFLCPLFFSFIIANISFAAILPTRTILGKTTDNSGSGAYSIEQEVQFNNGEDTLEVKETWLILNENTMRVSIVGGKDLQSTFRLQFVYSEGQKWSLVNGSKRGEKIPEDFLERYLNFRNSEAFFNHLMQISIIPSGSSLIKPIKKTNNNQFIHEPEPWVRLSRAGGAVAYAMGIATPPDQEIGNPGLWIEQDLFVVRKVRLKSQAEMTANIYNQYAKGLYYPRQRVVRWGANTATIRLISVSARPTVSPNLFQASSLDVNAKWEGLSLAPARDVITEFYSRFR